jgi:hypothetical protein
MNSDPYYYDPDLGFYKMIAGRRVLMDKREGTIRLQEEVAFTRANTYGRPFYVTEGRDRAIRVTDDPLYSEDILRICRPERSRKK